MGLGVNRVLALASALAFAAGAAPAHAASFSCEKASTAVEKLICQDSELSTLDDVLGRRYGAARMVLKAGQSCLVEDQRAWLLKDRAACTDALCLKRVYLQRLAQLDALQPGATANRSLELPAVPTLVWVVPPAGDTVAAHRGAHTRRAAPLVVRGKLLNEVAGGDGFWVQSAAHTRHLVVPLMFLEGETQINLTELAKEAGARFEVVGSAAAAEPEPMPTKPAAPTGNRLEKGPHFEPSRCTFIYRLPANQSSSLPSRGNRS